MTNTPLADKAYKGFFIFCAKDVLKLFLSIIVMALISIFWGIIALCVYKVHRKNKTCTKVAKGLLKELKSSFGIHMMPKYTGKLSFKIEKDTSMNVNYEKGVFERLPFSYKGPDSLSEPKEVTVMYDFKNPKNYYIKEGYWGLVAVIIPTTFCFISIFLTVILIVGFYLQYI